MNKKIPAIIFLLGISQLSPLATYADSFDSLDKALATPEKVTSLSMGGQESQATEIDSKLKNIPAEFGSLTHLKQLEMAGLDQLTGLPEEIGNLKELESIVIDNGNGSQMNISLPESIGNLTKLKVLRLYGALDARAYEGENAEFAKVKKLPQALDKLLNLEVLDLGRNGITEVPPQLASLSSLNSLSLDFNAISELPEFIGNLKNLKELSICSNGKTTLPDSLSNLNGLKLAIGNGSLKLVDQENLRKRFPDIVFDFTNEFDDESANEEAASNKVAADLSEENSQPENTSDSLCSGKVLANSGVTMRKAANRESEKICKIPTKTDLEILKTDGPEETIEDITSKWFLVRWNSPQGKMEGWVFGGFIAMDKNQ